MSETEKQQWEIPAQPPEEVTAVIDRTGRRYTRLPTMDEYWTSQAPGNGRGTYDWVELLSQRGPVRAA